MSNNQHMNHHMKQKIALIFIGIFIIALFSTCAVISAQENAQTDAAKTQKSKQSETVLGRADTMKSHWGSKKAVLMKGNVKFTHGDTILTSDQVEYSEESKMAISPGKINITDPECDITGDKGSAFFKKRLGIVEGNVKMLVKPKNTGEDKANPDSVRDKLNEPTTIICEKLEYLYKGKQMTATGNVKFYQAKRSATAQKAFYDQNKELLTLTGNVKGVDENGQTFSAPGTVVISLKKGDEWMEAQDASASFKIDLDDDESESKQ